MQVREIMSTTPVCVTPDTSIEDAARLMKERDVGLLPVIESSKSGRVTGVITDRDIAIRYVAHGDAVVRSVGDIMSTDVTTCLADADVREVMQLMGSEQVRRIPIVDERGALVGVVAQADIVLQTSDSKAAQATVGQISLPGRERAS